MKHLIKFNENYSIKDQIILSCADLLDFFDYELRPDSKNFQIYFNTYDVISSITQSEIVQINIKVKLDFKV